MVAGAPRAMVVWVNAMPGHGALAAAMRRTDGRTIRHPHATTPLGEMMGGRDGVSGHMGVVVCMHDPPAAVPFGYRPPPCRPRPRLPYCLCRVVLLTSASPASRRTT